MLFALSAGLFFTKAVKYYSISNLQNENRATWNENRVTWQDEDFSCGKPKKSLFSDEYIIVDNPLCKYSASLREIPALSYSELVSNPKIYDHQIIRVKGRYEIEPDDPHLWKSRLYMRCDTGKKECPLEFNSPWDSRLTSKLYSFIRTKGSNTNTIEVSLIIEFLDASNNPGALEINDNNPLQMTVLHVEEMKVLQPKLKLKR